MYNDENNYYRYSAANNGGEPNPYMRETVRPAYETPPAAPTPPVNPVPKKKKKNHHGLKITALALCCALLGGVAGAGTVYFQTV